MILESGVVVGAVGGELGSCCVVCVVSEGGEREEAWCHALIKQPVGRGVAWTLGDAGLQRMQASAPPTNEQARVSETGAAMGPNERVLLQKAQNEEETRCKNTKQK